MICIFWVYCLCCTLYNIICSQVRSLLDCSTQPRWFIQQKILTKLSNSILTYLIIHCRFSIFKTNIFQYVLQEETFFADSCTLMAHGESELQLILDQFSMSSKLFGLIITCGNTEVLYQLVPNTNFLVLAISKTHTQLTNIDIFKYPGSTIFWNGSLNNEIDTQISKAIQAMGRFCNRMLD